MDNTTVAGPAILSFGPANQTVFTANSSSSNGTTSTVNAANTGGALSTAVVSKAGAFGVLVALGAFVL